MPNPDEASNCMAMNELTLTGKLVNAPQLLEAIWEPETRPSLRWLRTQQKLKNIPFFRIGHLIFYNVEMVRAALVSKNLVRHRTASVRVQTDG